MFEKEPISRIEWIQADTLSANDYNPNTVLKDELKLLKFSMVSTGWIQPILAGSDNVIIDGFHRHWLSQNDKEVNLIYGGFVPVVKLTLTPAQRMLMTIRINRAKGVHSALKMHEIITKVIKEHGISVETVCQEIGATKDEVNLLLQEGVFTALNIPAHQYSKAWVPGKTPE